MCRPMLKAVALAVLWSFSAPREAAAWSGDGHRIVCRIAWRLLDQPRRDEIARLINTFRDPDGNSISTFWDACSFADDARGKANRNQPGWARFDVFETWHYVNVPRSTTIMTDAPCLCVISAVSSHADSLRNAASDRAKAEALFLVAHWVGDIHQPLHAAYADDRGGNDVRPVTSDFYSATNLHSLWDGNILARLMPNPDWQAFADRLVRDLTPAEQASWIRTRPVDWAQESYNLVTSTEAQYCDWKQEAGSITCAARPGERWMGEKYQAEFADDVAQRLQQAGVRLAELLKQHLPVP